MTTSTTTSLTATHLLILHCAAHRPEGRVLPLPDGIGNKGGSATRALQSLLRRELLQQEFARTDDQEWARAGNGDRLTLTITPAGRAAIGVTETVEQANGGSAGGPESDPILAQLAPQVVKADGKHMQEGRGKSPEASLRAGTKGAAILTLLQREAGATLPDLMAASGWQGHSVRGFLSGTLRKKHGLVVANQKVDGVLRYRVDA